MTRFGEGFDLGARLPGQVFREPQGDSLFCEYDAVPAEADEDGYWTAIGHASPDEFLDSIAVSADVIAVTGPSGRWGCWGERGPESAVFQGFPDAAARDGWCERFGPFLDAAGAVESYGWMAFGGRGPVPDEYAAALAENYGAG
ncbi:hypothetical protein ACFXPA_38315 [Amycolatopsis sp. NPDC059090]|uniref:hypothetical protein n=1 Tax=unclassified Amycolatopsis TaxID=2618356 RepID=UPI00366BC15B